MNPRLSARSPGGRRLFIVITAALGFMVLVVLLVLFVLWRDGRFLTGPAGRVATVLREVKKEERSRTAPAGFIQRLRNALPSPIDDFLDRAVPRNWKGEYEYREELARLGTNAVPFLIQAVESETSVAARRVSANALAALQARSATPVLARLLVADSNPQVRLAMAEALRAFGDTNAVPQLMEGLREDSDKRVRVYCAAALGDLLIEESAQFTLSELDARSEWNDQEMLISALARLRYGPAVPKLIELLQPPPPNTNIMASSSLYYSSYGDQQVRGGAAKALAEIGGDPALEALIRQLSVEKDENVGEAICGALAVLGGPKSVAALREQLNPRSEFRQYAVMAVGHLGVPSAVPDLVPLLNDLNDDVRAATARSLGLLGGSAALEVLRSTLPDQTADEVIAAVCESLVLVGDESDGKRVIEAFARIKKTRTTMTWILGHLDNTNAIPLLAAELSNRSEETSRFAAAYELALLGTEEARLALRNNLGDSDENARHAKACSLLMLGDDAALGSVRKSLRSKTEWQRFGAVLALDLSRLPNRAELLAPRQHDANGSIRRYATAATDGTGLAALLQLLQSGSDGYRQYAARALVFYRDTNAIPALKAACRDEESEVREAALLSLRYLEHKAASSNHPP